MDPIKRQRAPSPSDEDRAKRPRPEVSATNSTWAYVAHLADLFKNDQTGFPTLPLSFDSSPPTSPASSTDGEALHGIPIEAFYTAETSAYSDAVLEAEIRWRRNAWKRVITEDAWALLTDQDACIRGKAILDAVGDGEEMIPPDAWDVEVVWREICARGLQEEGQEEEEED